MEATTTKSNIQKKMLTYARDIALDKLNKKLDKRIAKQEMRKKEHENVVYERCSQSSDFITSSSEFTSSSSDINPNDKLATNASTIESANSGAQKLPNKNVGCIGQSAASIESSEQDEDYQTADEDEPLPVKKDVVETVCDQCEH